MAIIRHSGGAFLCAASGHKGGEKPGTTAAGFSGSNLAEKLLELLDDQNLFI